MRQLRKLFLQLAHSYIHTLIIPYATIKKESCKMEDASRRHSESRQFYKPSNGSRTDEIYRSRIRTPFAGTNVNKIMTIEASGIAPAIMTGYLMDLPVFAKRNLLKPYRTH